MGDFPGERSLPLAAGQNADLYCFHAIIFVSLLPGVNVSPGYFLRQSTKDLKKTARQAYPETLV
jgi:hypothetical protein